MASLLLRRLHTCGRSLLSTRDNEACTKADLEVAFLWGRVSHAAQVLAVQPRVINFGSSGLHTPSAELEVCITRFSTVLGLEPRASGTLVSTLSIELHPSPSTWLVLNICVHMCSHNTLICVTVIV